MSNVQVTQYTTQLFPLEQIVASCEFRFRFREELTKHGEIKPRFSLLVITGEVNHTKMCFVLTTCYLVLDLLIICNFTQKNNCTFGASGSDVQRVAHTKLSDDECPLNCETILLRKPYSRHVVGIALES